MARSVVPTATRGVDAASTLSARVIGGDSEQREDVCRVLRDLGVDLLAGHPDVVVCVCSADRSGTDLRGLLARSLPAPVILVARPGSERLAVEALRAGVADYLSWPVSPTELAASLERVSARPTRGGDTPVLHGESEIIAGVRAAVRRIAATPCNVLITGETGTGKEVVARLIHQASARRAGPFVSINCSALPDTLFESELFGYERGAFSGAQTASIGRLKAADRGTVFLDEIGELGLAVQPKLLRAIDQREVQRLGSNRHETIDVRWVAATNRDLQQSVRGGLFRADLYYRLNVYSLALPPLRERPEDIPVLARTFLADLARAYGRGAMRLTSAALAQLMAHDWPGNVRELHNVVETSVLGTERGDIAPEALPPSVRGAAFTARSAVSAERVLVVEALRASGGNKSQAARRLSCSRMTLYRKLSRHRIDVTSECDSVTTGHRSR